MGLSLQKTALEQLHPSSGCPLWLYSPSNVSRAGGMSTLVCRALGTCEKRNIAGYSVIWHQPMYFQLLVRGQLKVQLGRVP